MSESLHTHGISGSSQPRYQDPPSPQLVECPHCKRSTDSHYGTCGGLPFFKCYECGYLEGPDADAFVSSPDDPDIKARAQRMPLRFTIAAIIAILLAYGLIAWMVLR